MSRLMVITYDLRPTATPRDYERLAGTLIGLGAKRLFLAAWAIRSSMTPQELARTIWTHLDADADRLLVVEVGEHAEFNTLTPLGTV